MSIRAEFARLTAREYIKNVVIAELSPKIGKIRFTTPAINRLIAAKIWTPMNMVLSFREKLSSK